APRVPGRGGAARGRGAPSGWWLGGRPASGRAARGEPAWGRLGAAAERRPAVMALFPGARIAPDVPVPAGVATEADEEAARVATVRGHLARLGPCTAAELAARTGLTEAAMAVPLAPPEADGFALPGRFSPDHPGTEAYCDR